MASVWRAIEPGKDNTPGEVFSKPWGTYGPNALQRALITLTQKTILQRGAFRSKMTQLIMALGCPLDVMFRECCYRIEGRNNLIETGILTRPNYNSEEIEFLGKAISDGGVAVDIGCNIGLYSLPLARVAGPKGRVVSIDANPEMVRHLRFNAKASGLDTITAVNMAVGGEEARVDLQIRKNDLAIVRVEQSADGAMQMLPLLRILSEAGLERVDSLKIDIEGHEDLALVPFLQRASEDLLPSRIVIERASQTQDYPGCVAEFDRLGYRLVGQTRNNSMYQRGSLAT
jgi:FkbM family methyltransferase